MRGGQVRAEPSRVAGPLEFTQCQFKLTTRITRGHQCSTSGSRANFEIISLAHMAWQPPLAVATRSYGTVTVLQVSQAGHSGFNFLCGTTLQSGTTLDSHGRLWEPQHFRHSRFQWISSKLTALPTQVSSPTRSHGPARRAAEPASELRPRASVDLRSPGGTGPPSESGSPSP